MQYVCTTSSGCKWWWSCTFWTPKRTNESTIFSIGFSFACALVFKGCLSMLYTFCPMKLTFQFDSAFMFVISGLIVLSIYNGTSFKECTIHGKVQLPVHSNKFSHFFIVPLYYMALSHKDWELTNSRIWLAESDIDRGLDFPSRPASRPEMFRSEKVAN